MKKYFLIAMMMVLLNSCNFKQNENQDSFTEDTPVNEGVDNNDNFYTLGDSTQNEKSETLEDKNIPTENVKGEISQDTAIYEGVHEE